MTTSAMAREIAKAPTLSPNCPQPPRQRDVARPEIGAAPLWSCAAAEAPARRSFPALPHRNAASPAGFRQRAFGDHGISHATDVAQCPVHRDLAIRAQPRSGRCNQSARASGARTVAIVNAAPSPVADAAEFVVPIEAGQEHSVAATKTVIGSMAAGAELIAELAEDVRCGRLSTGCPSACTARWHSTGPKYPRISPRRPPCLWLRAAWAWARRGRSR